GIPHFGLAPFPINEARMKWSVAMPQPIPIMGKVLYEHMKAHGIKTVGYIGYSDSYGDLWFNDFKAQAIPMGMTLATEERFARPDTSVAGQVLKLLAANPDAILVGASGTAAALPQTTLRERGYKGLIYQTHGADSRSQFAGHSYDAFEVLKRVVPVALKTAKPGTPEFREAIRQALLTEKEIAASQGVYNFTEKDRYGLDD